MKHIVVFIIAVTLVACSTGIENTQKAVLQKDSTQIQKQKEYATQLFIDASLLDVEGKYAEAILDYQEALRLDPSPGIYYAIGKDYLRLQKLLPALENVRMAVKLEADNIEYLTLLGTIYNMSRNTDSSETVFNKIIILDSLNVNALYNLGQLYELQQPLKALKSYNKILEITGPEWNILLKIAELNERLGKVEETIKTAEELLDLNPSDPQLQKLLIESYIKNDMLEKALIMVDDALEIFPDDLNFIELRGNALVKLEKWDDGADEYKKIITKDDIPFETKMRIGTAFYSEALNDSTIIPFAERILIEIDKDTSDWQINAFLGELAHKREDDSLTLYYFRKSIDLAQLNSDLRIRLGQILFENTDYVNTAIEMEKAVEKFPNNHVINFILGLSLAQNSDHLGALPYLEKAVSLNPNDLNTTLAFCYSLDQSDREDDALIYLNRALRIDPKNIQALGMMGLIYDGKGEYAKSDSIYSIAVKIDSNDIMILNNFAYSLAERGKELEMALEMVQKAIDEEPDNSSYLDTIGWVYFKLGDYTRAKDYIYKAIENDEKNATLLDHLGDIYYKLGDEAKAVEFWKSSLEIDSSNEKIHTKIEQGLD